MLLFVGNFRLKRRSLLQGDNFSTKPMVSYPQLTLTPIFLRIPEINLLPVLPIVVVIPPGIRIPRIPEVSLLPILRIVGILRIPGVNLLPILWILPANPPKKAKQNR